MGNKSAKLPDEKMENGREAVAKIKGNEAGGGSERRPISWGEEGGIEPEGGTVKLWKRTMQRRKREKSPAPTKT